MRTITLPAMLARLCLLLLLTASFVRPTSHGAAPAHDKDFWRAVARNEGKLPDGQAPRDLAPGLLDALASTDPELRDKFAYDILVQWIYKGALTPDEVRPLTRTLLDNLRVGLGETGTDTVFRRSYSALILSVVAARNIDHAFLSPEEYRALFTAAVSYLDAEKDVRGFDAQKSWVHSVAHTADLLKFLAPRPAAEARRPDSPSRRVAPQIAKRTRDLRCRRRRTPRPRADRPRPPRVARNRGPRRLDQTAADDATFPEHPTTESLRLAANTRRLLTSLWAEMSIDERPSAGLDSLRANVREALRQIL